MRKIILALSIALVSMAAAPAGTATAENNVQTADATPITSSAASAPSASTPAAEDKKICRLLPSSFSRRTERVCLTAKEWKQVDENVEDAPGY